MTRLERARQFMPFAALHGYENVIHKKETVIEPRRELDDERISVLNETVSKLKKGDLAEAEYYSGTGYVKVAGAISAIDAVMRYVRIIKTEISFDDLYSIRKIKLLYLPVIHREEKKY